MATTAEQVVEYYRLPENEIFLVTQKALIIKDGKLLVLKVIDDDPFFGEWTGKWQLPGGLVEMDESLEDGLRREVEEETGIVDIRIGVPITVGSSYYNNFVFEDGRVCRARFVCVTYLCEVNGDGVVKLSSEHDQYKWVTPEEVKDLNISPEAQAAVEFFVNYDVK